MKKESTLAYMEKWARLQQLKPKKHIKGKTC